jgi:hypothetical protein
VRKNYWNSFKGVLWFSKNSVDETIEDVRHFMNVHSIERLRDTVNKNLMSEYEGYLGEPNGSLSTVLNTIYDNI